MSTSVFIPVASPVERAATLLNLLIPDVYHVAMSDKNDRGNVAFDCWFALRESLSRLRRHRSLCFTFDERAELVLALSMAHRFVGDECAFLGCPCVTALRVRELVWLLQESNRNADFSASVAGFGL